MAIGIRYDETFFSSRAFIMPIHPLINAVPKASIHRNFCSVFESIENFDVERNMFVNPETS